MQVRVSTKVFSSFIFSFFLQCRHNLRATLPATSPQPCNKVVTVSIPWFLQPCGNLKQGCGGRSCYRVAANFSMGRYGGSVW